MGESGINKIKEICRVQLFLRMALIPAQAKMLAAPKRFLVRNKVFINAKQD
jgi:hypothetical protein